MQILATVTVTTIVAIASGMILFILQRVDKEVSYRLTSSIPYDDGEQKLHIYNFELINTGTSIVEDIDALLIYDNNKIENYAIDSKPTIEIVDQSDSSKIDLKIKNLNPEEVVKVSLLASSEFTNKPEISVRARGINGVEFQEGGDSPITVLVLLQVIVGVIAITTLILSILGRFFSLFQPKNEETEVLENKVQDLRIVQAKMQAAIDHQAIVQKAIEEKEAEKLRDVTTSKDDQADIMAYFCFLFDLFEDGKYYTEYSGDKKIRYWIESERLTSKAIKMNDPDYLSKVVILFQTILNERTKIAKRSRAILLYNLAKLYFVLKIQDKYFLTLESAKEIASELVANRLKIDPVLRNAAKKA